MENVGIKRRNIKWVLLGILVTYLLMYTLTEVARFNWCFENRMFLSPSRTIRIIVKYGMIGIIGYLIPYERIFAKIKYAVAWLEEYFCCSNYAKTSCTVVAMWCAYIWGNWGMYWLLDQADIYPRLVHIRFSMLFFVFGLWFLIYSMKLIKNQWLTAILSMVFIISHTILLFYLSYLFYFAFVACIAYFTTWLVHTIKLNKKCNPVIVIVSSVIFVFGIVRFAALTGHVQKWNYFINGLSSKSGAAILEHGIETLSNPMRYAQYYITGIYYTMGILGVAAFLVLFAVMIVASLYVIKKLYEVSINRASMVLGIFLLLLGCMFYCFGQELGVLPISTLHPMLPTFVLPAMGFAFRLFRIKHVKEKEVPSFEELHDLQDADDESDCFNGMSLFLGNYYVPDGDKPIQVKLQMPIEWISFQLNETESLLVSKYALDWEMYGSKPPICWNSSYMKDYLGELYNTIFSEEEKEAIIEMNGDKLFLLSKEEIEDCFADAQGRRCVMYFVEETQEGMKVSLEHTQYWLRNDEASETEEAFFVTEFGEIKPGAADMDEIGVRPAMIVDTKKARVLSAKNGYNKWHHL